MRSNKVFGIIAATVAIAVGLTACTSTESKAEEDGYRKITAEEAKERMDSGDDIVVLDVRTMDEYEEKHIPNAILIPNEEIGDQPLSKLSDLNQEILVYCRSGNRSAQAAKKMIEAGYTNVYDFGGINDWPYETEIGEPVENAVEQNEATNNETEESTAAEGVFGTFSSKTIYGDDVTQEIFAEADLTMVNIWGTFCGNCIKSMPLLAELNDEYSDSGLQIIGIITDVMEPENETAMEIIEKTGADFTHIIVSEDLYYGALSQIQYVPTTIFVDKEGKQVGTAFSGAKNKEKMNALIDDMLKEVQSANE